VSKPVKAINSPIRLEYEYSAGEAPTRFLRGISQKKIIGQRCPITGKVYVPSAGASPTHGVPTIGEVEVSDKGTVTTFCIVRIPTENLSVQAPFVAASVLLDGADSALFHVIDGCPVEEVRMGMRVQAEWVPDEELAPTLQSIKYFKPIDEPDADFESYKEHL
jgi:uncharacterized OB-fold protein